MGENLQPQSGHTQEKSVSSRRVVGLILGSALGATMGLVVLSQPPVMIFFPGHPSHFLIGGGCGALLGMAAAAARLMVCDRVMQARPGRYWLSFGLTTMFAMLTLVCVLMGWLSWNVRQLRERDEIMRSIESTGARVDWGFRISNDLPLAWRLLGAQPVERVLLPDLYFNKDDAAHFREFFPEASMQVVDWPQEALDRNRKRMMSERQQ